MPYITLVTNQPTPSKVKESLKENFGIQMPIIGKTEDWQ